MVRRQIDRVELRPKEGGYEFDVGRHRYGMRFEDGAWRLDQFELETETLVQTLECESLAEAVHFALEEREWMGD